jgi:hypothetical protein
MDVIQLIKTAYREINIREKITIFAALYQENGKFLKSNI